MTRALVLGGGGLTGQAFHLGVLCALSEAGYDARDNDLVVGTSAGSLVAAGLTAGFSAADQAAMMLGEAMSAEGTARLEDRRTAPAYVEGPVARRRRPLAPGALLAAARWGTRPGAIASSLIPAGKTTTEGIRRSIGPLHGSDWPDNLRVCAIRAKDARRVVFGAAGAPRSDVGTAVAASCAIPGYFTPVHIDGRAYVDGGGHSPTNADVVLKDRPELVVISSPMSFAPGRGTRTPDAIIRIAVRRYLAREVRQLRKAGATVVVFQPTAQDLAAMGLNPMKLLRGQDVVDTAGATVRARLEARPELREQLALR